MIRGYLLDTNMIEFWFNRNRPEHAAVSQRIAGLPDSSPLVTSSVVVGEIRYGCSVSWKDPQLSQEVLEDFIRSQMPYVLPVNHTTAAVYGELRARLFEKLAPRERRTRAMRPEELTDPVTSKVLGIQENDLWIAAQTVERNLVFVTHDKLARIREAVPEMRVEDWSAP